MKKIFLIIQREYLSRVKKKSFIVMTIIGPILMASLIIAPVIIAHLQIEEEKKIGIIDETTIFYDKISNTDKYKFEYLAYVSLDSAKAMFLEQKNKEYYAILHIPKMSNEPSVILEKLNDAITIYSEKQPSLNLQLYITNAIEKELTTLKAIKSGIKEDDIKSINTDIRIRTATWNKEGKKIETYYEIKMALGFIGAILIYTFIFIYGTQVMRGVIEEKASRIVEILISSVKPFQLMMGKIIGIAMVGLTQFLLWVIFTFIIVILVQVSFPKLFTTPTEQIINDPTKIIEQIANPSKLGQNGNVALSAFGGQQNEAVIEILNGIKSINFGLIISCFIFYFIGGYLLYASMFAAVSGAVDNEADTQQFILPITIPLIFSIVMMSSVINNPDGQLGIWLSIIPFTSPVLMMARIPFNTVTYLQLFLSIFFLILGFIVITWLAGKIYRTGILLYGKKISYKDLWRWIRY